MQLAPVRISNASGSFTIFDTIRSFCLSSQVMHAIKFQKMNRDVLQLK